MCQRVIQQCSKREKYKNTRDGDVTSSVELILTFWSIQKRRVQFVKNPRSGSELIALIIARYRRVA